MINVSVDHSYEDNSYVIDSIEVTIDDPKEKQRIQDIIKSQSLEGKTVDYPDTLLTDLSDWLEVEKEKIDIDTNESDLY